MLLRQPESDKEGAMSIGGPMDLLDDREFGPVKEAHEGRAPHIHAHHHSPPRRTPWAAGGIRMSRPPAGPDRPRRPRLGSGRHGAKPAVSSMSSAAVSAPLAGDHLCDTCLPRTSRTTSVLFDTGPGGAIDVGGNVEAVGSQSAALFGAPSHETGASRKHAGRDDEHHLRRGERRRRSKSAETWRPSEISRRR